MCAQHKSFPHSTLRAALPCLYLEQDVKSRGKLVCKISAPISDLFRTAVADQKHRQQNPQGSACALPPGPRPGGGGGAGCGLAAAGEGWECREVSPQQQQQEEPPFFDPAAWPRARLMLQVCLTVEKRGKKGRRSVGGVRGRLCARNS